MHKCVEKISFHMEVYKIACTHGILDSKFHDIPHSRFRIQLGDICIHGKKYIANFFIKKQHLEFL